MSKPAANNRLGSDFSLGGEQAEADSMLQLAFYESGHYKAISSQDEARCFVIGRTGSGKSAVLQRIEEEYPGKVIRINPEDLSLPYIADLGVLKYLTSLDVHLDLFFGALWKHVLLVEIIRHRYSVNSQAAKANFLSAIRDRIMRDKSKTEALQYLEDFEGKFWCETDERVRDIITKFEEKMQAESGGKISFGSYADVNGKAGSDAAYSREETAQQAERFQRIVNDTQLARLNKMISVLDDDILDSPQHYTYVLIDDLDRDWVDERVLNDLIRCLFKAVVDLKRVKNLRVIVALRTNIFEQLNFGSKAGGQEEKYRSYTLRMRWTRNDLEELLSERARVASEKYGLDGIESVKDLLPPVNVKRGNPLNHILDRTLMRPRDAIAFLNESFVLAAGKPRLSWGHMKEAERPYSVNRLLALRDEWKPSFPGIDMVFDVFEHAREVISCDKFVEIMEAVVLLPADSHFEGVEWMTAMSRLVWSSGGLDDWKRAYHPLVKLLFDIGFIGCMKKTSLPPVYAYESPQFVDRPSSLDGVVAFVVHPAFRAALDIGAGD